MVGNITKIHAAYVDSILFLGEMFICYNILFVQAVKVLSWKIWRRDINKYLHIFFYFVQSLFIR